MSLNTLLSSAYSPAITSEVHSSITYKPLHLHPNTLPPPPPAPPSKPLTATQKRAQKIHQIPKSVPPTTLRALHALWSDYATDLLRSTSSSAAAAQLMASAEFVGARVEVVRSACPSLVGIVGVCVIERRGVVYIACEESGRVRGAGKGVCVFRIEVGGGKEGQGRRVFEVHGRRFLVRPGERGGKKFKGRGMLEL
ncbi:unnamed protein product [Tuber melanosporum]|uniref:(Perigord truffle) hypothetical protein n=1 Tax=Tuber melanosporum (strain Mel28) TaxID=656061 RepID=D5GJ09_TUBMM|nr:uncharacterized protein GSTUM_00008769001 [Tuber melanosporum]CAZ84502.1 unnamed protein product [Tuber melanosporum]